MNNSLPNVAEVKGVVVIVDGFSTGALLASEIASRAACVHVLSDPRHVQRFPGGEVPSVYRNTFVLGQDSEFSQVVEDLRHFLPIHVIPGSEWGVELAEKLATALAVPSNSAGCTRLRRNKFSMAEAAGNAGLAVAAQQLVSEPSEAVAWMLGLGLRRAVAKPMSSAASDHVYICDTPEALGSAVAIIRSACSVMLAANDSVLIQEFLYGTEYVVNAVSSENNHKVSEVWRVQKKLCAGGRNLYDFDDLCDPSSAEASEVIAYVLKLLPILGIRHGASHVEVMRGPDGVRLIELAARVSGAANPTAVREVTGHDQIGLMVDLLTAVPDYLATPEIYSKRLMLRCVHMQTGAPRLFDHAKTLKFLQGLPTFSNIAFRSPDGARLVPTVDVATCPGAFFLIAASQDDIERDFVAFRHWEKSLDEAALAHRE